MRLIDADKLKGQDFGDNYYVIKAEIDKAPTIPAVPIEVLQEIRQEIIIIDPQISRETETDSGEMSATGMKNICVQIIDTHISTLNKEMKRRKIGE